MSSLSCNATHCVFTRMDTNGTALGLTPIVVGNETETFLGDLTSAPWTDLINQDNISDTVSLTRDFTGGLFNAKVPSDQLAYFAPSNTEWALLPEGKTLQEARCSMTFCSWNDCFAFYNPVGTIGKRGVVHLIQEDEYYHITLTNWTSDYAACPNGYCPYPFLSVTKDGTDGASERMPSEIMPSVVYDGTNTTVETTASVSTNVLVHIDSGPAVEMPAMTVETVQPIQSDPLQSSFRPYPIPNPYPTPEYVGLGGGFSYVRDKIPIKLGKASCPRCELAKADPAVLSGPIDNTFVTVSIVGVTPKNNTSIVIKAVTQDQHPKCNLARALNGANSNQVRPNARINNGTSTASLRRTLIPGEMNPFRYTIWFEAQSVAGTCAGQVSVCVPPPGFSCDSYMGYDATATSYCM